MIPSLAPLLLALPTLQSPAEPEAGARLVVLISVDQLMPEQLDRMAGHLDGGIGRLLREGRRFPAALPYAVTETGPGHATFATGCLPSSHGVVANSFYDRISGKHLYCVEGPEAKAVTTMGVQEVGGNGRSPVNLRRPSLGAHLRKGTPDTKIVSISAKDRAAITMAGEAADAVLWWDRTGLGFVSSDHYCTELPAWAKDWNEGWLERTAGWIWEPTFSADDVPPGTAPDVRPGEGRIGSSGPAFPYVFGKTPAEEYSAEERVALAKMAYVSPLVDRFVIEQARRAVETEGLGADGVVDLLCVSFSACDTVGHTFGPFSHETTDLILRLDEGLGELFADLDQKVGEGRWVAALTADHGVLPLVETLAEQGLPAARLTIEQRRELQRHVEKAVAAAFELDDDRAVRFPARSTGFFFDAEQLAAQGLSPAEVRAVVAKAALEVDWVHRAYPREHLLSTKPTDDEFLVLARASNVEDRGMDVQIVGQPYLLMGGASGTSHGSPHPYDRRVPLLFYGPGFEPGTVEVAQPVGPECAVPTLLDAIGREPGGPLDGRSLLGSAR